MTTKTQPEAREEHWISLTCICGNRYDAFCGYRDETIPMKDELMSPPELAKHLKYRYHPCPKCNHVWDLRPDCPKQALTEKQMRSKALLNAAISGV